MKKVWIFLSLVCFSGAAAGSAFDAQGWEFVEPGFQIQFPRDHGPHFSFRTEWWYFTGNLKAKNGREFGYQLTFFRHGYRAPSNRTPVSSNFVMNDLIFGHFTVTDVQANQFHFAGKASRGAFAEAGFMDGSKLVWLDDWEVDLNGNFHLKAAEKGYAIDLTLEPAKPPLLQGDAGFSRKAAGEGHASEYYSITRLATSGAIWLGNEKFSVSGNSWFDREWATNQLAPDQAGWNWFAIQFSDGSDLMLYQMRLKSGGIDQFSSGKLIRADNSVVDLGVNDFELLPQKLWLSPESKARYPVAWKLRVPKLNLATEIHTPVENQELNLAVRYWEGCIRSHGTRDGMPIDGVGYMELTGYHGMAPEGEEGEIGSQ
ncbi:MAG: lipocalin-like domain-containing protein [Chthoniobacterales bacterium]